MIYYTADLHFHYLPALEERPFATVEEMDRTLVQNWNETVSPEDTVYLVGDIGYHGGHVPCRVLERLRGKKHLVRGNHDTGYQDAPLLYRYFETITDFTELDDGGAHLLLCHYPMLYDKGGYMIHGHLHRPGSRFHGILQTLPRVLNAGVDVNGYRPVTLAQLVENNRRLYSAPAAPRPRPRRDVPGRLPRRPDFRPLPERPAPHPRHLFLTGPKGVGKTTVLRRLLEGRDVTLGGFLTLRRRTPAGGDIHMLPVGREALCGPENLLFTRRNGVLFVDPARFDRLGCALLEASANCGLLVMDELGPAESEAAAFQQAVLARLEGPIPVYGVLQQGEIPFLEQIRSHPNVQVFTVTEENRSRLPRMLLEQGW